MNKGRRHELKMLKFKKRIKALSGRMYSMPNMQSWHVLRTTGKPCSCYMCSWNKYNRAKVNKKLNREQCH